MKPLITISIPVYNGCNTIESVLISLIKQIQTHKLEKIVEVSLTDDNSSDDSKFIISKLTTKYKFLRFHKNTTNLGMDGNFVKAAMNANGKYVWFSGQDDIFLDHAIQTVVNILTKHDLVSLYVDFKQYDEIKNTVVCNSMVKSQLKIKPTQELIVVKNATQYFNYISDAPSFLPATIIKKNIIQRIDLNRYFGTHYIQYAAFILSLGKGQTGIYAKPLIKGLIPVSGWQKSGNKLFEISFGKLYAQFLLNKSQPLLFPNTLFFKKKVEFLLRWPKLLVLSTYLGFSNSYMFRSKIYQIFSLPISCVLILSLDLFAFLNKFHKKN